MEHALRAIRLGELDVTTAIDENRLNAFGLSVLFLCALVIAVDGFDVQVISYVAPVLTSSLHISRSMLGPVFSSGLVGTTIGALVFGPLADRAGRKTMLCLSILLFAAGTLATMGASGIGTLVLWRAVSGLGLGGATPIAVAFAAEFSPRRIRSTAVMLVYCGFAVGAGGGGMIAARMLPALGWRAVFLLGGLTPLVLLAALLVWLPRSIEDLGRRGDGAAIAAILKRLIPGVAADPMAVVRMGERAAGFPVGRLFAEGRAVRTAFLWAMFFTNILALYFMVSWLPTLAHASGLSVADAVRAGSTLQLGSLIGTILLSLLARRLEAMAVIGLGFLGGAASLALFSVVGGSVGSFTLVAFLAGFFVIGTQTGANAVGALIYPASLRATGIGWALGIGRAGSILGPSIGGMLLAMQWPTGDLFIAAAVPALLASVCAFVLSRRLGGASEVVGAAA